MANLEIQSHQTKGTEVCQMVIPQITYNDEVKNMAQGTGMGWWFESRRHALARKGIRTKQTKPTDIFTMQFPVSRNLVEEDYVKYNKWGDLKLLKKKMLKDTDADGIPDRDDCDPYDPKRQHTITRYKGDLPAEEMAQRLKASMNELGYDVDVHADGNKIIFRQVRLSEKRIKEKGYNISPYTGRRGRILNWHNWVEVNNNINKVLDEHHASANIKSLGGKFKIREGTTAYTEADWDEHSGENVGSMVNPVLREEAWHSEKEE